jgi:hypothetical protein
MSPDSYNVDVAMGMADYLVGQVGIKEASYPSLLGAANHDQLSLVFVGELRDPPAGTAMICDVSQYVAGSGNTRDPETTNRFRDEAFAEVGCLDVNSELFDDLGLENMENVNGRMCQASHLDSGIYYLVRFAAGIDGHHDVTSMA